MAESHFPVRLWLTPSPGLSTVLFSPLCTRVHSSLRCCMIAHRRVWMASAHDCNV